MKSTRFALLSTILAAALVAPSIALASDVPAPAPSQFRMVAICDNEFEGLVGKNVARTNANKAPWKMEVAEVDDGTPRSPTRDRLKGDYPMFILIDPNGRVVSTWVGLEKVQTYLDSSAQFVNERTAAPPKIKIGSAQQ